MNPIEPHNEDGVELGDAHELPPVHTLDPAPKRGRGRPRKDPDAPSLVIPGKKESATVYTLNGGGGSVPKAPKQKAPKNLDGLKVSLSLLHMGIAARIKDDTIMLSDDECHLLAKAIDDVLDYYKISFNGKYGAWGSLVGVIVAIYGPKLAPRVMISFMGRMNATQFPKN